MSKKNSWHKKYFLFSWRKAWIIVVSWFLAVFLHNLIYGLGIYFGGENFWGAGDEAFFFIIAIIIIPLYVLITICYSLVYFIRSKKCK